MKQEEIFRLKKIVIDKLEPFGFKKTETGYIFEKSLNEDGFLMQVFITEDGIISTKIIDKEFGDEYTLHLSEEAVGGFVGQIKKEYEGILSDIAEKCAVTEIFKWKQTHEIIDYVDKKYAVPFEHLWEKFPENAIWRRSDNKKWFGIVMTVDLKKLGFENRGKGEVMNLRIDRNTTDSFVDGKLFFPAYHMNKKNWYSVILDGTVANEKIFALIDESFALAKEKPKK